MKKALHAKPFRLQMPGHTPRHARPEPARSKLLRGVRWQVLCFYPVTQK